MKMKISMKRLDDHAYFEASNERGHTVHIDDKTKGQESQGATPMELMLMSVGSCTAIDVIYILKKMKQPLEDIQVEVEGTRKEGVPSPYEHIHVTFFLRGDIQPEKALRAAQLSAEQYCSASKTVEPTAKVTHSIVLNMKPI